MRRSVLAAALLLLAAAVAPLGTGQVPSTCEPDCLAIDAVGLAEGQSVVVADGQNAVQGTIANEGSTPKEVRAYFEFTWEGGRSETSPRTYVVPAGGAQNVNWARWTGPAVEHAVDSVTITLWAWVQVGGQEAGDRLSKSVTRTVEYHDLGLDEDTSWTKPSSIPRGGTLPAIARVQLTNNGNVDDVARLTIVGPPDWTFTVPSEVPLAAGASKTIDIGATAPADEGADGTSPPFTLHVATSEPRTQDDDSGLSALRDSLELQAPIVQDGDDLRVTVTTDPASGTVAPGATVTYTVKVYNPTDAPKDATVEFGSDTTPTSGVTFPLGIESPPTLAPGGSATFERQAVVDASAFAASHAWWVKTTDTTDDPPGFVNQQPLVLHVDQIHEVDFVPPASGPIQVTPGQNVAVGLELIHLGNGDVTLCVEAALPAGWTHDESDCEQMTPAVDAAGDPWRSASSFSWLITVPSSAPAGGHEATLYVTDGTADSQPATLQFNVPEQTAPRIDLPAGQPRPLWFEEGTDGAVITWQDLSDADRADRLAWLELGGAQIAETTDGPDLPVAGFPCIFGVEPGKGLSIPVDLRNAGNMDGDFLFSVGVLEEEGSWTVADPAASHSLPEGDEQTIAITVTAPTLEAPGLAIPSDFVMLHLVLQEVDSDGEAVPGRSDEAFCAVLAAFPDLTVLAADPASSPVDLFTDHPSVLHFDIINAGWTGTAGAVQVRSVIEGPGDFLLEQEHEVDALDAYPGTWWRPLDVHFNATEPGDYTYTVEVDPDHLIEEPEDSDGPDGVAPDQLTGTVELREFRIEVLAPPGREVIPEQTLTFEELTDSQFVVKNVPADPGDCDTGPSYDLTLSLTMEPAWRSFEDENVTLGPCEEHVIEVTVQVPENPFVPEATITLRASNDDVPTMVRQDAVRLRVDDDEPPTITGLSSNVTHVLVGGSVDFVADITDAAGIDEARLILVAPDGVVSQHAMEGGLVGSFTASVAFDTLGHHDAYVWARDGAVSANTADTSATPMQIEVLSDDEPHVRLVDPDDGSYLRPGVPVVLTVLSKHPIVHAQYGIGGSDTVVAYANPLQLATDDWPEGATQVEVTVRDSMGVEAQDAYSFVVDGTPPVVADVRMDPPGAAPGTLVRVVAVLEDEHGIAAAEVRVARAGGQTETIALVDKGSTWAAEATLPADVSSVTVVATDLAGNRGFGERVLQDTHGVEKVVPGPAIPLLIAALAALAALGIRRRGPR